MAKKLKPKDLINYIDNEVNLSSTYNNKINSDRAQAIRLYNREPFGNEKRGRSNYVSAEVLETISWALPQIMRVLSTRDIISFDATTSISQSEANMARAYADNVIYKQNNGFLLLHNFFHDALLQKNSFLKVYVDTNVKYEREEYEDLNDFELAALINDPAVEPLEHNQIEVIDPNTQQRSRSHSIVVKRRLSSQNGQIKIETVPVEEVIVSRLAKTIDLDQAPFVAHKVKRTISWLRQQGFKIDDDINDGTETDEYSLERESRERQDGSWYEDKLEETPVDPSMRLVWVVEAYFHVDYNGDGIAELRKVTKVGQTILENVEVYAQPFISTSPFPQPHKFNGLSLADIVKDLQLLKSMIMRSMLDSFAFNINPTKAVDVSKIIDVNDLLDTNPGNYLRFRGDVSQAVTILPSSGVGLEAFNLLNYIDDQSESRSGVSKMTQGIDKNVFNKTATGTQAIMSASQEKLALIIRIFAETGLGPLYQKVIKLASKFFDEPQMIAIEQQFVNVNPRNWKNLTSITINAGTGSLDKQQLIENMNGLLQMQEKIAASGRPEIVSMLDPMKIYNAIQEVTNAMGVKSVSNFFNNPMSQEYQMTLQQLVAQQQMNQPQDAQMEFVKVEQQKVQQQMMLDTADFELEKLKADREFELKKYDMQLKYELEMAKLNNKENLLVLDAQLKKLNELNPGQNLLPQANIEQLQMFGTDLLDDQGNPIASGPSLYEQMVSRKQMEDQIRQQEQMAQQQQTQAMMSILQSLNDSLRASKRVVRDEQGRVIGLERNGD